MATACHSTWAVNICNISDLRRGHLQQCHAPGYMRVRLIVELSVVVHVLLFFFYLLESNPALDVNVKRPREYWDYESLVVNWGFVAFIFMSSCLWRKASP